MSVNIETLSNLEAVLSDPEIQKVFDTVRAYNELLAVQRVSYAQLVEIVNEIDGEWQHLLGETAIFSGQASFLGENDDNENSEPVTDYYENEDMVFRGIVARQLEDYDSNSVTDDACLYELRIGLIREGISSSLDVLNMHGSAMVDEIFSLEFDRFMSPERARSWLEYFCPEVIDDIDECLLNANVANEAELVIALTGSCWELNTVAVQNSSDEKMLPKIKAAFQVYIESLFQFDSAIGYGVEIDGATWLKKDQNYIAAGIEASALATKVTLMLDNDPFQDDEWVVKPHLKMTLHDDDKDETPLEVLVPVDSVADFVSIRARFHEQRKA